MKRVSSRDDFPNVDVYERDGPVYMVSFRNRETYEDFGAIWRALVCAALAMAGMASCSETINRGYPWWLGVIVWPGLILAFCVWLWFPKKVWRSIELDRGRDRLRVFRKGRLKVERKLSLLSNLTIEEHQFAAVERQKKRGGIGPMQKQHCLVGWFGAGGGEQVELLCRYEWPPRNSLFEVRQATIWTLQEKVSSGLRPAESEEEPGEAPRPVSPGIKPPLD